MHQKPIGATGQGAIDYEFLAMNRLVPSLLGLKGLAKALCYGFAATQGLLNAFAHHPLSVKKVIPLTMHGELRRRSCRRSCSSRWSRER